METFPHDDSDLLPTDEWGIPEDSDAQIASWWESLTDEQRAVEISAINKRLKAAEKGRGSTAEEVMARIRARHNPEGKKLCSPMNKK
jgi:hypothetical protein